MQDILTRLAQLSRPRLLIQAARNGIANYRRETHLPRLLGSANLPRSGQAIMQLCDLEASHNDARRIGDAAYRVSNHVEILIALMAEAQLLRQAFAPHESV